MRVFAALLELLFPPRETERILSRVSSDALPRLAQEVSLTLDGTAVTALLPYREPVVRAHIVEAKFHAHARSRAALASILAECLRDRIAEERAFHAAIAIIPVPLGKGRRRERGENQVAHIATRALALLHEERLFAEHLLVRTRETPPQTTRSGAARRENMKGAFRCPDTLDSARSYFVIDDVVTTGATLVEAIRALKEAGATRITAIALAG